MTDNENKLRSITQRYQFLKMIADLSPLLSAVLMIANLSVCITLTAYVVKIENSAAAQDQYRETIIKYREQRIATEQAILDNQKSIKEEVQASTTLRTALQLDLINKINQIILNQASGHIRSIEQKSVLDSVKSAILNKNKN